MSGADALVVVATAAEAARLPRLPGARVVVSGVGAVNAALAAQRAILERHPALAVSAGIGGAMPGSGLRARDVVVASEMVYANLGAMDGDAFLPLDALGFALLERGGERRFNRLPAAPVSAAFARLAGAAFGPVLTVETVTGSAAGALALERRWPGALVEAMEGAGVAHAALSLGVPCVEVRAVSNAVGPRDRAAWDVPGALAALAAALEAGWAALER